MISVIIVDYNTAERCSRYVFDFIFSIDTKEALSFIIVDNSPQENNGDRLMEKLRLCGASELLGLEVSNDSLKRIKAFEYKKIPIIYISTGGDNFGFAKANNIGALMAKELFEPDFILFSNSDIQFPEKLELSSLLNKLNSDMSYGLIGPKVIGLNGKDQSPAKYLNIYKRHIIPKLLYPFHYRIPSIANIDCDTLEKSLSGEVHRIIGAFMLIKTHVFLEIDGFDENTFLYAEELILSERLRNKGYKTIYEPGVCILHEQGVSTNEKIRTMLDNIIIKQKRLFKSELYYYRQYKNISDITYVLAYISFKVFILKEVLIYKLKKLFNFKF